MTEKLWESVASGGAVAVIMCAAVVYLWKWWSKREDKRELYWISEVNRVRQTGKDIIAQKDELLSKKDDDLKELARSNDDRIASIVKTYDAKIKEKDDLLNTIREEIQELLVNDTTVKTRLTDSINNLHQLIKDK